MKGTRVHVPIDFITKHGQVVAGWGSTRLLPSPSEEFSRLTTLCKRIPLGGLADNICKQMIGLNSFVTLSYLSPRQGGV